MPPAESQIIARELERAIHILRLGPGTRVFQVGASDGVDGDPVFPWIRKRTRWQFYRVEPRPMRFLQLQELHDDDANVTIHQACVVRTPEEIGAVNMFEYQNLNQLPGWAQHEGSTRRSYLVNLAKQREMHAVVQDVSCWGETLTQIMEEMFLQDPDIVVADMCGDERLVIAPLLHSAKLVCYCHAAQTPESSEHLTQLLTYNGFVEHHRGLYDIIWRRAVSPHEEVYSQVCGKSEIGDPCANRDCFCGLRKGCTF